MNDFRQNFFADSINNLKILQKRSAEDFDEDFRREAFRIVHTIKGGAQTFGLKIAAELSARLENLLSNREILADKEILFKGFERLADSLRNREDDLNRDFINELEIAQQTISAKNEILTTRIPLRYFKKFSQIEQTALIDALFEKENVFCVEAFFELSNFAAEYRDLRKLLSENGQIIAALPGENPRSANEIVFQIFLTTPKTADILQNLLEKFSVKLVSQNCTENLSSNLFEMFSQIVAHVENLAKDARKQINLTILANNAEISAETVKTLFDLLLHLVRNGVDHAIEKSGKINVRFFDDGEDLFLSVADNGKGVDLEKVRAQAVAKNLISDDYVLNESQTLELIFASELSTAETLTETSGRGVGLDAVKNLVEKRHGKISVKSRNTIGTIFEIYLPKN